MANIESSVKPFLKWAGGKAKLVSQIRAHFPPTWNPETDPYIEPFLGGGAMFFALQPKNAILNDANERLMQTYAAIRDNVESVISDLRMRETAHKTQGEAFYYAVRARFGEQKFSEVEIAADFIFLNKAGFSGIYRVNASGGFNVPWGKRPDVSLCDPENLRLCSAALQSPVSLTCNDFWEFGGASMEGAVVYCDPPYVPRSKTSAFTSYTPGGFTYADQIRLLAKAVDWRRQGAHVILSQAADPMLIEQYRLCGFSIEVIQARRNINSKGDSRGPIDECIIY
jgi:DNA adenine methylase